MRVPDYPFTTRPLSDDEGGGILIEFPDLPGCASDGETLEEALENKDDAVNSWIMCAKENGDAIPEPFDYLKNISYSGKILQRVPKSIHRKLSERAKTEGVSINSLILSYISQGLGYQSAS